MRSEILPRLKQLLEARMCSPELIWIWGEFRLLSESLSASVERAPTRRARAEGGAEDNKDPQMKFYLHFRRYHEDELGWTAKRANAAYIQLVRTMCSPHYEHVAGFDTSWWERAY